MSLLLKSLGKMKLSIPEKDYAVFIHAVYNDRNEFSLTELIDAIWGISRMGEENSSTWKLMDSPVSQEIDTLFRITEGCSLRCFTDRSRHAQPHAREVAASVRFLSSLQLAPTSSI